jgi:hypothetical protein
MTKPGSGVWLEGFYGDKEYFFEYSRGTARPWKDITLSVAYTYIEPSMFTIGGPPGHDDNTWNLPVQLDTGGHGFKAILAPPPSPKSWKQGGEAGHTPEAELRQCLTSFRTDSLTCRCDESLSESAFTEIVPQHHKVV